MRQTKESSGLVLVVEDNRNISEMIGEYLEGKGFEVDYAADGLDGYRLAAENSYDVVVLDLMLPRLDGIEVCRRLRNEARKSTPVLMLTARDTLDDKLTGLGYGADEKWTPARVLSEHSKGTAYARLIKESPRYEKAESVAQSGSAMAYASALQKAGYATDPEYARKLSGAINSVLRAQRAQA